MSVQINIRKVYGLKTEIVKRHLSDLSQVILIVGTDTTVVRTSFVIYICDKVYQCKKDWLICFGNMVHESVKTNYESCSGIEYCKDAENMA